MPRPHGLLSVALVGMLALAACKQKETGPDVAASATAPVVAASPRPSRPMADFATLDADRDGRISAAEHAQAAQALFEMLDAEHDGNLVRDELQSGAVALADIHGLTPDKLLAIADNDHDGRITLSEWIAFANARFGLLDRNGDGFVDQAEWSAPRPPMPSSGI